MPVTVIDPTSLRCRDCAPKVGIYQRHYGTMPHTYLPSTKHPVTQQKTTTTELVQDWLQYDHIPTIPHISQMGTRSVDLTFLNTQKTTRIYTTINSRNKIDTYMRREETESRQPAITWLNAGTAEYAIPKTIRACPLRRSSPRGTT